MTLFSKNSLQSTTNTKSKYLMDLQAMFIQNGAESQDGHEFRIFAKIQLPQHA
jgi:hypothetical protein